MPPDRTDAAGHPPRPMGWLRRLTDTVHAKLLRPHGRPAAIGDPHALMQQMQAWYPDTALLLASADGWILLTNRAAELLTGQSQAELARQSLQAFAPPALRTALAAATQAPPPLRRSLLDALPPWPVLVRADGQALPVHMRMSLLRWLDADYLCVQLTMQRAASRVADLQAAVDRARTAAPEPPAPPSAQPHPPSPAALMVSLRGPMAELETALMQLDGLVLSAGQRLLLEQTRANSARLRVLFDTLQELQSLQAGTLVLARRPFDVRQQLSAALRPFEELAAHHGLDFFVRWDTPQRMLVGDPERIALLLCGVVEHLLTTTRRGRVIVDVTSVATAGPAAAGHADLWLAVDCQPIDDAGRPPADNATDAVPALRAALLVSDRLCAAMAGELAVAWRHGQGPLVRARLRCDIPSDAALAPVDAVRQDDRLARALPGARILVVDDNRTNQRLVERWLNKEGATVRCASDGQAAVTAVSEQRFDAILMDVSMPQMNGLDATRAIRAMGLRHSHPNDDLTRLPIIGLSAHAQPEDRARCLDSGMTDYIVKPIQRDILLTKVAALLARHADHGHTR